ncbi:lytic transglycosylase domain-containing protein [Mycetohabitans sp. B8]|uniref:lytic transglycosylase domain-containing protein n=1 Tax=Mycetohabitans sp. B8 TaxID=2841845 RepID=UPI001F1C4EE5|nr:lytic transglycosylase domain-containing protein [Mycetohabitans sp. B8]MCG1042500.1 lytic transglycosylase domain-containing protein [Mycetohabitans sp. B8]
MPNDLRRLAIQEAHRHGVDLRLIVPMIGQESAWNPDAMSAKGAGGIMQLMPATARDLGLSKADRFDPHKAIPAGIRYFKQQLKEFGSPALAYAAYNAGPANVRRYGGIPPFRETQHYVNRLMAHSMNPSDAFDGASIFGPVPRQEQNAPFDGGAIFQQTSAPLGNAPEQPVPQSGQPATHNNLGMFAKGAMHGVRDLFDGGAYLTYQGGQQLTSLGGLTPNPLSNWFGSLAQRVSDINRAAENQYQQNTQGSAAAGAGRVVGNIATSFIPGVGVAGKAAQATSGLGKVTQAAKAGAKLGVLQNTRTQNDSVLSNAAFGGIAGPLGQGLASGIGRIVRPVQTALTPQVQRLAQVAQQNGINLTLAQRTASKPLALVDAVMGNLPLTAGVRAAEKQAQQSAFNRAVGRTFGAQADELTPSVIGEARNRIGQQFSGLAQRNTVNQRAANQLVDDLASISHDITRYGVSDTQRVVSNVIDDVLAKVESRTGTMSGQAYRELDSQLGKIARNASSGDVRHYVGQVRESLRRAMDQSINNADRQAWRQARQQYANLMTVAPVAAANPSGNVSTQALLRAVNSANKSAKFTGGGELGELARVGKAFIAESVPNSGTAQRAYMQNLLTNGLFGAGAGYAGGGDTQGAAIGALAGLAGPRAIQLMLGSPAVQAYMMRGLSGIPGAGPLAGATQHMIGGGRLGVFGDSLFERAIRQRAKDRSGPSPGSE